MGHKIYENPQPRNNHLRPQDSRSCEWDYIGGFNL